jgi:hypothetical protein
MAAHLAEVLVWSVAYAMVRVALPGTGLVYFVFVNYTTLGYGDVIPLQGWQLLGPMTAMSGVLMFGGSGRHFRSASENNDGSPQRREWREPPQCAGWAMSVLLLNPCVADWSVHLVRTSRKNPDLVAAEFVVDAGRSRRPGTSAGREVGVTKRGPVPSVAS